MSISQSSSTGKAAGWNHWATTFHSYRKWEHMGRAPIWAMEWDQGDTGRARSRDLAETHTVLQKGLPLQ